MSKTWSISTTVRNPERLRDFLVAAQPLDGKPWNENQENYQKLLIKNRLYGFGNQQFYNGLPRDIIDIVDNIDIEIDDATVERIVEIKNYNDFAMRGRQSLNPLTKFGFVFLDSGTLKITALGRKLIASEKDSGEAFLRSFIKWQIPNPANADYATNGDYDVVPFVATLKLIHDVNKLEAERKNKPVGISKREFSLFVPTLINHRDISRHATEIIAFRDLQQDKNKQERKTFRDDYRQKFAVRFLGSNEKSKVSKLLTNLHDYGDNTIRYFRLTKFIRIRGDGFYIDLEPSRQVEIEAMFENDFYKPKLFAGREEYLNYMSDDSLPKLPWQTKEKLSEIAISVHGEINSLQNTLGLASQGLADLKSFSDSELEYYIAELRAERKALQEKDNHVKSQPIDSIAVYIAQLENIFSMENRALVLEHMSTMGLHALNDAKEIKPNYPVGDDNEPTSTAPGGMADIECYYDNFSMICEVTMLNGRDQWFNEGQPVMRHLRDFENSNANAYCVFIAPNIHTDSAETFWVANTVGYKGSKQKIAPLTIMQFVAILKTLKQLRGAGKGFSHTKLESLIEGIAISAETSGDSDSWVAGVGSIIDDWSSALLA